jgi:alkylhydroperoxidase/carboxymuconolactone decarboxylase family protein YurZ
MRNTTAADIPVPRRRLLGLAAASGVGTVLAPAASAGQDTDAQPDVHGAGPDMPAGRLLAIGPVAAATATGDMARLGPALEQALDAGLSLEECKEILVQLYAYAGFPRSLNALAELMKVAQQRHARGLRDAPGRPAGPLPTGQALLEAGTARQTRLSGAPVQGPLFDFAPAIDRFLKTHLFGDIFGRDNLDWPSRELATVAALAAMDGVEPQLAAHVRISLNVGLKAAQLEGFIDALSDAGWPQAAGRARAALRQQLAGRP